MCQVKTVPASAAGRRCNACRCQASGATATSAAPAALTPAAAESSAEKVLRQLPTELVERLFHTAGRSVLPAGFCQEQKWKEESAKQAAHTEPDRNSNDSEVAGIIKTVKSLPCDRRRVQFADELGHSLVEVRLFESVNSHFAPYEPTPLYLDLLLQCHFEQPSTEQALRALHSSDDCNVQLSGLHLDPADDGVSVTGYALVKNLTFEKQVFVRITADSWRSFADLEADYASSLDNSRDMFEFELRCKVEEVDFEFCICFTAKTHGQYWDNNRGINYRASLVKPRRAKFSLWDDQED